MVDVALDFCSSNDISIFNTTGCLHCSRNITPLNPPTTKPYFLHASSYTIDRKHILWPRFHFYIWWQTCWHNTVVVHEAEDRFVCPFFFSFLQLSAIYYSFWSLIIKHLATAKRDINNVTSCDSFKVIGQHIISIVIIESKHWIALKDTHNAARGWCRMCSPAFICHLTRDEMVSVVTGFLNNSFCD